MCKIAKIWKLVFKRLLWRHADFWGHLNSPSHYILKHYFLPITSPPPKSKLIALIELYHLKISNVIWERQEVEFCTSHKKLSRLTSTRSLFCREKKPEHHHQQQKNPKAIWDNLSCAYSKNSDAQDLGSCKVCFQLCLNIAFLSGQGSDLCSDARQVMINRHLLVKVIGRLSSGNSWDGWCCLIFADVVVTPAKRSLCFRIRNTIRMDIILIVITGKTSWWFCFLFKSFCRMQNNMVFLEVGKWAGFAYQDNSQR